MFTKTLKMGKNIILNSSKKAHTKAAVKAVTKPKGLSILTSLVFYKHILTQKPVTTPLILRNDNAKTANGLYDKTGKQKYRFKSDGVTGKPHKGVDLKGDVGDSVFACGDGIVTINKPQKDGFGSYIIIHHLHDIYTLYAHLSEILVTHGEKVKAGHLIGKIGKTGNVEGKAHLHFETYSGKIKTKKDFKNRKTVDPSLVFQFQQEPETKKGNNKNKNE